MNPKLLFILILILTIVIIIVIALTFYKKAKTMTPEERKAVLYQIVFGLVVLAEQKFGGKTGDIKYAWVVMEVYKVIPDILKQFVTAMLGETIQIAVDEMKRMFVNNPEAKVNILGEI